VVSPRTAALLAATGALVLACAGPGKGTGTGTDLSTDALGRVAQLAAGEKGYAILAA
jgi:hypothetical protein